MNWDDSWTCDLRSKWFKMYHEMRTMRWWDDDISGDVRPSETLFVSTCLCVALCHREDIPTWPWEVSGSLGGSWISMPKVPRQFGNLFQRNKQNAKMHCKILKRCATCAIQSDSIIFEYLWITSLSSIRHCSPKKFRCRYSAVGTLDGDSGDAKKSNRHAHAWRLRPSGLPRPSPLPTFKAEVASSWNSVEFAFCQIYICNAFFPHLSTFKLEFWSMDTFELSPSLLAGGSRNEKSSYEEKMFCLKLLTCQVACWCASCPSFDLFRKSAEWKEQNINCHETRGNRSSWRSCHEWW